MKPSERTQSSHSTSRGGTPPSWTLAEAEAHLASLELFGMRFGLDRMRRMMTVLGSPQQSFDAIHIVGTNGKTSTTRMLAAILERHGMRTGAYTSPHLLSYCERLQLGEHDIEADAFAAAIARAAWAAERVNRTLAEDDRVTQFELLTAAALWAIAERGVQVAAVEAGLGGRYDATSVIAADVTVLTNIGLEHTRWLGPTLRDIAEEKLAVLPARTTLVLGEDLAPEALAVARRVAAERRARIAPVGAGPPVPPLLAGGSFQRLNFAQASAAAEAYLGTGGGELSDRAVAEAAASTEVPGRLQLLDGDPPTVLDGAHNPAAARALRASLPEALGGGPLALVLGVLEDKDAARMLDTLLPVCERAWFTAPPGPRALPPPALQSLARQLGFEAASCEPRPARALDQARLWARERGGDVLVTGSIYLVGDLLLELAPAGAQTPTAPPRRSRG
jgi:dihydrofolate synthase/folylpolyglutamate synthase